VCREVWPENDCFGNENMAPEEEFMAIRDIFMANIQSEYKEYCYWEVQI
jgi:timeless